MSYIEIILIGIIFNFVIQIINFVILSILDAFVLLNIDKVQVLQFIMAQEKTERELLNVKNKIFIQIFIPFSSIILAFMLYYHIMKFGLLEGQLKYSQAIIDLFRKDSKNNL